MNTLVFSIVIGFLVACVNSEPTKCYSCADATTCKDAGDVSKLEVKTCVLKDSVNALTDYFKLTDVQTLGLQTLADTATNIVCTKIGDETGTYRGCAFKVAAAEAKVDICDGLKALGVSQLSCSTCESDLCNSSSTVKMSLVIFLGILCLTVKNVYSAIH